MNEHSAPMLAQAHKALANMIENCKRDLPWFHETAPHGGSLVIVGGGPSLKRNWQHIRAHQKIGAKVLACNGALKFLLDKGITPDFALFIDVSPVVAGFLDHGADRTLHMVASCCDASVFDTLNFWDAPVCVWHPLNPAIEAEQKALLDEYRHRPSALIGGGNTGVLRAMPLGYLMGFRTLHMFGVDSCLDDEGADHAYTKHDGPETDEVGSVTFRDKTYRVTPWMANQARQFTNYYPVLASRGCQIVVHGDGLIPDTYRAIKSLEKRAA